MLTPLRVLAGMVRPLAQALDALLAGVAGKHVGMTIHRGVGAVDPLLGVQHGRVVLNCANVD